jgi:hypothetical protein
VINVFKKYGFTEDISFNVSCTGKGYHIIGWHNGKGVSKRKLLKIRYMAGDDTARIWLDSKAHRQINVLFTHKKKNVI